MVMRKGTKLVLVGTLVASSLLTVGGTTFSKTKDGLMDIASEHEVTPENPFTDVDANYWAYTEINWGVGQGLVFGYDDGTFRPSKLATQAQFLAILTRFAGEDLNESLSEDHWADVHYDYLAERNFPIVGEATDRERNQPVRRGDIARILSAYLGKDLHETEAIAYLFEKDISTGRDGEQTIEGFGADDPLTRAQLVTFMYRMAELGYTDLVGLEQPSNGSDDDTVEDIEDKEGTFELVERGDYANYVSAGEQLDVVRDMQEVFVELQKVAKNKPYKAEIDQHNIFVKLNNDNMRVSGAYSGETVDGKIRHNTNVHITIGGNKNKHAAEAAGYIAHALFPDISQKDYQKMIEEAHESTNYFEGLSSAGYYNSESGYSVSIGGTSAPDQTIIGINKVKKREGDKS
ncbi:S-layer homology domain-containing protein [Bacillus piscicola]|uniref:S-layer homology domain-containing protein n=1 Tax=Bacillus piscicola TaxID=1632684 RepID=UPI001F091C8F|nr:S-layer homology domain-containing protein [Bacillus piscicola]